MNKIYKFMIALAMTLVAATVSSATKDFYVSPNGKGDGSSYSKPSDWATGLSNLGSIDRLILLGGQYDLSEKQTVSKSGTAEQYKVIMSYPGERAILDFRNEAYGQRGISISEGTQYVHLLNLTIRYTGKNAIINYGSNCIIEGIDTYGNGDTGIQHKTGGNNLILNCDSHDNFDYKSGSLTNPNFGGNADGFADKQYTSTGVNTYRGCRAWNNSDDGWDFYQRAGYETIIENCVCYNNGPATIDMSINPRATGIDKAWFDGMVEQTVTTTRDKVSATYTITLAKFPNGGNGNGFKIGGDRTVNTVTLKNCLAVGNFARGYDQNNNAGSMTLYNCSAYDNGTNFGFSNISGSSVKVRNCVSLKYERSADYFQCPTTDVKSNSWDISGVKCTADDFLSLDVAALTAERNSDGEFVTTFMHPTETSDLIDKGMEVGIAYGGTAPDLGWIETGDATSFPAGLVEPSNKTQNVATGSAIEPIVYKWSGGATGIEVTTTLPDGLTQTVNEAGKTLTISGTIATQGTYTIGVQTTGGTGDALKSTATVIVKSASSKKVAYCTTNGSDAADAKILETLYGRDDLLVTIVDVTSSESSSANYSGYDLIVISPVPGSTAAGMANLEKYAGTKPMLLLKPFSLKTGIWEWGTAVNTTDKEMEITAEGQNHEIFKGLATPLSIFSAIGKNAVTGITHSTWDATAVSEFTVLATPASNSTTDAIVEVPVGKTINGVTTTEKFMMIGISEASTANLTSDAQQLISNACDYLLGGKTTNTDEAVMDTTDEVAETYYVTVDGRRHNVEIRNVPMVKVTVMKSGRTETQKMIEK